MHASGDFKAELIQTVKEITAPGKGILAADESTGTIGKRFEAINVENNHENRQAYRDLLFTAPDIEKHISGVIMFDETVRDKNVAGDK
jgi:fructose-bisphosphate aldolase, class I